MKLPKIFSMIAALFTASCGASAATSDIEVVSPTEFETKLTADPNALLIDARTPEEYTAGHLQGARLIDWLDSATFKKESATLDKSKTIYIYCRSGKRSLAAAKYLSKLGFKVIDMDGGITAWQKARLPIVK